MEHAKRRASTAQRQTSEEGRRAQVLADHRPAAVAQRALSEAVHAAPAMVAQRRAMESVTGGVAQRSGPEEELQMKAAPGVAQRAGPEEELQMKAAPGVAQRSGPEEELQLQAAPGVSQRSGPEEELQMKAAAAPVAQLEEAAAGGGSGGLPAGLSRGIQSLSGVSVDDVQVHYNSSQPADMGALAYAQGRDIHVAPGQEATLPHEAWHIVQQAQGRVQPTRQMKDGAAINDDPALEREADVMGAKALQAGVAAMAAAKP